jgi:hypothetical protein
MPKLLPIAVVLLALPLGGCGLISTQSVYEGFRTQQRIKDAGSPQPPESLGSYDAYKKEREKAKSPTAPTETP